MLVTGRFGLKSYSLADPAKPQLLDEISSERLKLPGDPDVDFTPDPAKDGDPHSTFWQNEDMDVDQDRKLVLISRDPRSYNGTTGNDPGDSTTATNIAGVYVVDASDPEALRLLSFQQLPTGHTTTCINRCRWLWTGGPASTAKQKQPPLNWTGGRPIIVTDLSDPRRPRAYPMQPVDLFRKDGVTAYSHDVQVDDAGVAWVSGDGGTRGYWTDGRHYDPLKRRDRNATPLDPVPYAGGGLPESGHGRRGGRIRAQRRAPDRQERTARGRPLQARGAPAGHRGGLLGCPVGLQRAGHVQHRVTEGLLQRRGVAFDSGQAVPAGGRRHLEPVPEGGLAQAGRTSCRERTSARRTTSTSTAASSPTPGTARVRGSWTSRTRRTRARSPTGGPRTPSSGPPTCTTATSTPPITCAASRSSS